jgi:hypothetical protein
MLLLLLLLLPPLLVLPLALDLHAHPPWPPC